MIPELDLTKVYAADYETYLMGPQNVAPKGICFSVVQKLQGIVKAALRSGGDDCWKDYITGLFKAAYNNPEIILVFHNAKFDTHVACRDNPELYHIVCELYARGQIQCTILIEKLINLTTTGRVATEPPRSSDPDAKGKQIRYSLDALVMKYLDIDISVDKKKADSVRTRYQELAGVPSSQYPAEFKDYSIDDSKHLINVYEYQQQARRNIYYAKGFDPLKTLQHRCEVDFHLYRFTMEGVHTNPEQIERIETMLEEELSYDKLNLLYPEFIIGWEDDWYDFERVDNYIKQVREKSILKPALPVRPRYTRVHEKGCEKQTDEWGIPINCLDGCFYRGNRDHVKDESNKTKKECKPNKFTNEYTCDCPPAMLSAEKYLEAGKDEKGKVIFVLDDDGNKIPRKVDLTNNKVLKNRMLSLWKEETDHYEIRFGEKTKDDKGNFLDPELYAYEALGDSTDPEAVSQVYEIIYDRLNGNKEKDIKGNIHLFKADGDWMDIFSHRDPHLQQFAHRASLIKLQTTEIPRMKDRRTDRIAKIVHGNYDVLKETGRTSGFAGPLYPSANLQNIHKMARSCYKAREGHWMLSTDYSGLEFISAAQRALDEFGESVYADIINKGYDTHSYLGAQRAVRSEDFFMDKIRELGIELDDYEAVYHEFMKYKKDKHSLGFYEGQTDDKGNPVPKDFFKHYRTSAKPVGLGILGGLGCKTLAQLAVTQGIMMTEQDAKEYKEIWETIFHPEARLLQYVKDECKDYENSSKADRKFTYTTTMGMVRPNCTYASCTNGRNLQSNSAEGATRAIILTSRAAYDPCFDKYNPDDTTPGVNNSVMFGNFFPWGFIHDEVMGDVVADPKIATSVATLLEEIMVEGLLEICPDVRSSADSALMIEWSKKADEYRNIHGQLIPWECSYDKELAKELEYVS